MNSSNVKRAFTSILIAIFMVISVSAATAAAMEKVIIFHAGSLTVPLAQIEKDFEAANPGIDILREAGGSTKMARMISELGKPADLMASADYKVIDKTLIPGKADWNIRFATNQLVLCFTDNSRYADRISADNWYEILQKKEVVWGHSDPNLDPCGYRSLMVLQLAEKYTNQPGLIRPVDRQPAGKECAPQIRGTGLHAQDREHGLCLGVPHRGGSAGVEIRKLDDHINLGNYKYDDFYKQAQVKVTGKKPGTWITRTGKSLHLRHYAGQGCPQCRRGDPISGVLACARRWLEGAHIDGTTALRSLPGVTQAGQGRPARQPADIGGGP